MLLKFSISDFIEDRQFKNLSPATIKNYSGCLKEFHIHCVGKQITNIEDITQNTIKQYLIYCQKERGNNPTSINTKMHILKIFFNYLADIETIAKSPLAKMNFIKEDIKIEVFTDEHIKKILRYFQRQKTRSKTFYAYRDYFLCIFLLGTGSRLGEAVNTLWTDVNIPARTISVTGKKRIASSIAVVETLKKEILEYQYFSKSYFGELPEYIFCYNNGRQMTPNSVKQLMKRAANDLQLQNPKVRLSAHTFRHTFSHRYLMAGGDLASLQKMLRHASIKQTEKYLALWGTALQTQNDKYNPLNNLVF